MARFPGGWNDLQNQMPMRISDIVSKALVGVADGEVLYSDVYNSPTGGSWVATPISINAEPTISAVFVGVEQDKIAIAESIGQQTKMYNSSAPPPFADLVYLYGNPYNKLDYQMEINLDLGGSNYDLFQLSIAENACTNGDVHGNIEVFDFGAGPFTGVVALTLIISGYFGPINFGIRLESTANQSSLYEMRSMILPVKPI